MSSNVVALNSQGSPTSDARGASNRRFVFTETRLAALRPVPGRTIIYYDERSPLAVRVTPAGAKTYLLYKWVAGRPVKLGLGRVDEVKLEDAKREARVAVAAIVVGKDPVAERKAARVQGMTFDELWEAWKVQKWAALRDSTKVGFESCWRLHIQPALGTTAVKKIASAPTCSDSSTGRRLRRLRQSARASARRLRASPAWHGTSRRSCICSLPRRSGSTW